MPERSSTSGVPYAPHDSTTVPASITTGSPRRDEPSTRTAAVAGDSQPVDQHLVEDAQRAAAHGVEVGEGCVPAHVADHVHRLQPERRPGIEVAQVAGDGPAERLGRIEAAGVERAGLVALVGAHPHPLEHLGEQRRDVVAGPARQTPPVVLGALADGGDGAVVRCCTRPSPGPARTSTGPTA